MLYRSKRVRGAAKQQTATDTCMKAIQKRDETRQKLEEANKDPKYGRIRKSKAALKKWLAEKQLARCLSRHNRRQKAAYDWESKRHESLMAKLRPSLSQRFTKTMTLMTSAAESLRGFFQNANHKLNQVQVDDMKEQVRLTMSALQKMLETADMKMSQVEIDNVNKLISSGNGLVSNLSTKVEEVNLQKVHGLVQSFTSAADTFVSNEGNVKVKFSMPWSGGARVIKDKTSKRNRRRTGHYSSRMTARRSKGKRAREKI